MARFGQQFIQGLLQPSYQQGLFGLGSQVGQGPAIKAERQKSQGMLAQIQEAISSGDLDTASKLMIQTPGYEKAGLEVAQAARDAAQKAKSQKVEATQGRGKGELMSVANDPTFDLNDAKMRSGYIGMADSFGVSRQEAIQIALDARKAREEQGKDGKVPTYATVGDLFKDENGNVFKVTERRTSRGIEDIIAPVGHKEPQKGKLTPAGGAYGETASEVLGRGVEAAGQETKAEEFSRSQQEALDSLPKIEVAIANSERSLELLNEIKTGGFGPAIVRSAQQFLGVEPKDQAEFNLLAGKTVLDNLSNFPGAISEGERNYLERLYQSLERSGGANQAILENLLQEAQFYLTDAQAKANASSYQDYLETRPSFSSASSKPQGPKKVKFTDLK